MTKEEFIAALVADGFEDINKGKGNVFFTYEGSQLYLFINKKENTFTMTSGAFNRYEINKRNLDLVLALNKHIKKIVELLKGDSDE